VKALAFTAAGVALAALAAAGAAHHYGAGWTTVRALLVVAGAMGALMVTPVLFCRWPDEPVRIPAQRDPAQRALTAPERPALPR
jgi:phage shock protein PspC (stress-responsive transcriptional regulator)